MAKKTQQAAPNPGIPFAMQSPEIPVERAIQFAAQQIDQGQLSIAEAILQQILQKQPRNVFAMHLSGVIAHRVGRTELAVELYRQSHRNSAISRAISLQPWRDVPHSQTVGQCHLSR